MQQRTNAISIFRRLRPGLGRHLILVLLLKLVLLAALWYVFVKPYRVAVDDNAMSARIAGSSDSTNKEKTHDRSDGR